MARLDFPACPLFLRSWSVADISRRMQPYDDEYTLFASIDRLLQECEDRDLLLVVARVARTKPTDRPRVGCSQQADR